MRTSHTFTVLSVPPAATHVPLGWKSTQETKLERQEPPRGRGARAGWEQTPERRAPSLSPGPPPSRLPAARCPQQVARGEGAEGESSGCSDTGGCTRGQSQAPTLSTRRESGLWTTRQPAARGFQRQSWGPSTRAGLPGRNRGGLSGGALTGLTEEGEAGLHPGTQDR